jgi:thiol-disulfide isomerase/thioredoxin
MLVVMKRLLVLFSVLLACGSAAGRALRSAALLGLAGCLLSSVAFAAVHEKPAEPLHISHGAEVALTDFLVPGKLVIFDFTSKFCGPCQAYNGPLQLLHEKRADIVVVKVDINRPGVSGIDWDSPVAQQFDLHSIPHFKVYNPAGKLIAEDKIVLGPDGSPDRTLSSASGRRMVDGLINDLAR